jgi:hypothetical protein
MVRRDVNSTEKAPRQSNRRSNHLFICGSGDTSVNTAEMCSRGLLLRTIHVCGSGDISVSTAKTCPRGLLLTYLIVGCEGFVDLLLEVLEEPLFHPKRTHDGDPFQDLDTRDVSLGRVKSVLSRFEHDMKSYVPRQSRRRWAIALSPRFVGGRVRPECTRSRVEGTPTR